MTYATMNTNDTLDMQTVMTYVNTVSDGIFWPIMLLSIWLIWVLGSTFIGKPVWRGILYASFLCSVLATLMTLMNWLSPNYMYFLFFMTAVGLIWTKLAESFS